MGAEAAVLRIVVGAVLLQRSSALTNITGNSGTIICPTNDDCRVNCIGVEVCDRADINPVPDFSAGHYLHIYCSDRWACRGVTIAGTGKIDCTGAVYPGGCSIECYGDQGCKDLDLHCPTSGSAQCQAYCDTTVGNACHRGKCDPDSCATMTANWATPTYLTPSPSSPTTAPTQSPTSAPNVSPTRSPTTSPTKSPTAAVSASPTQSPTTSPTVAPTVSPTRSPTTSPTMSPTAGPVVSPTQSPTADPTVAPTVSPTRSPTTSPTKSPTAAPSVSPTRSPASPTVAPTISPARSPTTSPTMSPTAAPSVSPNQTPTAESTVAPTASPTGSPTASPRAGPTAAPSASPTASPTAPTAFPVASPTTSPTVAPSGSPTWSPTAAPTQSPTLGPTSAPNASQATAPPSVSPSLSPTAAPSVSPTLSPSVAGASPPTLSPTTPTGSPTQTPTTSPTGSPIVAPSVPPTRTLTAAPTRRPTDSPTTRPTAGPTVSPTQAPAGGPTDAPLVAPTQRPTVSAPNPTTSPSETITLTPLLPPEGEPPLGKDLANAATATAVISSMALILSQDVMIGTQGPKMARFFDYASCPPDDHADLGFISNPTGAGKRSRGASNIGQKDDGSKAGQAKEDDEGDLAERRGAMLANLGLLAAFVVCNACCGLVVALIKMRACGNGSIKEGLATARFPSFSFFPALFMYQNVLEPAFHLLIFGGCIENRIMAVACAIVISMVPVSTWMMTGPDHLRVECVANEEMKHEKLSTFLWGSHNWVSSAEDPTFERRFALIFKDFRAPYKRFLLVDVVVVSLIALVSAFVARNATQCSIQISAASLIEIAYLGVVCKCRPFIADLDHWYTIILTAGQICAITLAQDDKDALLRIKDARIAKLESQLEKVTGRYQRTCTNGINSCRTTVLQYGVFAEAAAMPCSGRHAQSRARAVDGQRGPSGAVRGAHAAEVPIRRRHLHQRPCRRVPPGEGGRAADRLRGRGVHAAQSEQPHRAPPAGRGQSEQPHRPPPAGRGQFAADATFHYSCWTAEAAAAAAALPVPPRQDIPSRWHAIAQPHSPALEQEGRHAHPRHPGLVPGAAPVGSPHRRCRPPRTDAAAQGTGRTARQARADVATRPVGPQ
eukprot:TRINITY_DN3577_c0_g2_i4.p1 TRINITY_DN3577_c0_g2~~TRINITY_DN3577_c0_g2_i4.p1  ORF type:complete len:1144 (+),score=85.32 TRINITY_DN3577_c0_g2_i4:79-3432(+)